MGNRALVNALDRLAVTQNLERKPFRQVVLTAPDVAREDVEPLIQAASDKAERVTLYASSKDKALGLSSVKHDYERLGKVPDAGTIAYREETIQQAKDLRRAVDYLETRTDIDHNRLAYYAVSWGAALGSIMLAVENRITVAMLVGRFLMIVPMLAVAGNLAQKKLAPPSAGMFPVNTPLFTVLLVGVILIVGALTFFPALALGPILEHLLLQAGKSF